jgi:hypothetical protein
LIHSIDLVRQPGITIARTLSNTFAGIDPAWPASIVAQFLGALAALSVAASPHWNATA